MRRALPLLGLLLAALAGCHRLRALEPPDTRGAGGVLLLHFRGDALIAADGLDVEPDGGADWPEMPVKDGDRLVALLFSCPLDQLGMSTGALLRGEPPAEAGSIPEPASRLVSTIGAADSSPWAPLALPDPLVEAALVRLAPPRERVCDGLRTLFGPEEGSIRVSDTATSATFGVTLLDGRAFIGLANGTFLLYDEAGAVELDQLPAETPHHGAYQSPGGDVWLVGNAGELARGRPESGFVQVSPPGTFSADYYVRAAGPSDDSPFELFVVTDARSFDRYDGQRWTRISSGPPYPSGGDFRLRLRPSVAWVGPEEAIGVQVAPGVDQETVLMRYDHGDVEQLLLPPGWGRPAEVARVEGYGVVLGMARGQIARYAGGGRFEAIGGSPLSSDVRLFAPLRPGILVGDLIELTQYFPSAGFCTRERFNAGFARHVVPFGQGSFLLLGRVEDRRYVPITKLLHVGGGAPQCLR